MTGTASSSTIPAGLLSVVMNAETTLRRLRAQVFFWPPTGGDDLAQQCCLGVEVECLEPLLDRGGAHAALEVETEAVAHLAVQDLIALEVLDLEVLEPVPNLVEAVDLLIGPAVADLCHLALGAVADLALDVGLGALGPSSARSLSSFWAESRCRRRAGW